MKMKNECSIVKDLLPLYAENMLSEDTAGFVKEHLSGCADCCEDLEVLKTAGPQAMPAGEEISLKNTLKKIKGRVQIFTAMIIIFGAVLGVGLINHSSIFYNIVIMPIIGALGYVIMRWRALYNIPIILVLSSALEMFFGFLNGESISFAEYFGMLIYFVPCAFLGIVIAALYAFAFRKEDKK